MTNVCWCRWSVNTVDGCSRELQIKRWPVSETDCSRWLVIGLLLPFFMSVKHQRGVSLWTHEVTSIPSWHYREISSQLWHHRNLHLNNDWLRLIWKKRHHHCLSVDSFLNLHWFLSNMHIIHIWMVLWSFKRTTCRRCLIADSVSWQDYSHMRWIIFMFNDSAAFRLDLWHGGHDRPACKLEMCNGVSGRPCSLQSVGLGQKVTCNGGFSLLCAVFRNAHVTSCVFTHFWCVTFLWSWWR